MSRRTWILGGLGAAGCVAVAALLAASPYAGDNGNLFWLAPPTAAVFIATGLWAWSRRPDNRTGLIMVAGGFAWLVNALAGVKPGGLAMIGWTVFNLPFAIVIHLLVSFPSGRLERRSVRWLVGAGYFSATVPQIPEALLYDPGTDCTCWAGRHNPFQIATDQGLFDALTAIQTQIAIWALVAAAVILARRYRAAGPDKRHALRPVLGAGLAIVLDLVLTLVADITNFSDSAERVVDAAGRVAVLSIPVLFLVGLARSRFSRAVAVAALAEQLQGGSLEAALAGALGDPTLRVAYAVGDRFVDERGVPVDVTGAAHTLVERDGRAVGALVHDPALAVDDPEALRSAAAAAGLAMENVRLQAERIEDLRASRARIVRATDEERRRLERDLHDGAQQRLVSLALTLRLARGRAEGEVAELIDDASAQLQQATDELRELARGIHPAVLTDQGLAPAVRALAARSTVPVRIEAVPAERLPAPVESAAYFVVAEALTNVARYSGADEAAVSVARANGHVTVTVSDDGVGGADPAAGSGLRGLADRVAAIDGTLEVASPSGAGTTIRARLPCGS